MAGARRSCCAPPATASIADRLDKGLPVEGLALESALWCRYCEGTTDSGKVTEPNDPNWDRLQAKARDAKSDAAAWLSMDAQPLRTAKISSSARLASVQHAPSRGVAAYTIRFRNRRTGRPYVNRGASAIGAAVDSRVANPLRVETAVAARRADVGRSLQPASCGDRHRWGWGTTVRRVREPRA